MASINSHDRQAENPQVNHDANNTLRFETRLAIPLHDNLTDHVPIEIVFVILSLLGTKELCKVSLLNSFYLRLSKDESLWKPFCSSWGIDEVLGVNWKDLFKRGLQDQRNMLQRIEECRKTRLRLDSGWIVEKGDVVMFKSRPCKVASKCVAQGGKYGSRRMVLTGIDIVTGKKYKQVFLSSAAVSPVKEPIKSIITEYLLSDLKKAEEADGGEVDILVLLNLTTGETRSKTLNKDHVDKGVSSAWENAFNTPSHSVTLRVLDISWCGKDGADCTEGIIMDSHLWEG